MFLGQFMILSCSGKTMYIEEGQHRFGLTRRRGERGDMKMFYPQISQMYADLN